MVKGNSAYGIGLWRARNNIISGNTVSQNDGVGITLIDSSVENFVEDDRVANNGGNGILVAEQSSGNRVTGNTVTSNGKGVTTIDPHDESSDDLWLRSSEPHIQHEKT